MEVVNGKPADPEQWYGTNGYCPHCYERIEIGTFLESSLNQGLDALDDIPKEVWLAIGIYGFVWPLIKWTFLLIVVPTLVVLAFHFLSM